MNITQRQLRELEGLAYWIADKSYIRERFGEDPELENVGKNIKGCFNELDKLETPFPVQNMVICWAENWRKYKSQSLTTFLKSSNVKILEV